MVYSITTARLIVNKTPNSYEIHNY